MARCLVIPRIPASALDRLRAEHDIATWDEDRAPTDDELRGLVAGAEGLLSHFTNRVDAGLLDAAPGLRVISNLAVGTDNVDLTAAGERGIPVGNTPDVLTETTADMAIGLMLAVARRMPQAAAELHAGRWPVWDSSWMLGRDVHGATLGIVGAGRIGSAVAKRAQDGFGMEVLTSSRTGGMPLAEVLERSDFVSLHCPLTPDTRHLIDSAALARMRRTAYLVNTARGPIVDQAALADALRDGSIAGAALDVMDPEPLPPDDPLLSAPNLVVLPHVGSATIATRGAMAQLAVDNLLAGLAGLPLPHAASA
jgi:glyoxylate reductase